MRHDRVGARGPDDAGARALPVEDAAAGGAAR